MRLSPPVKAVIRQLARHWYANPLACDTPDGMLNWWLEPANAVALTTVEEALVWMEQRGLIEQLPAADQRVRFRRVDDDVASRLQRIAAGLDVDDDPLGTLH
jgi:hypothetical protein